MNYDGTNPRPPVWVCWLFVAAFFVAIPLAVFTVVLAVRAIS